jgi:gas vesicle protein
MERKEVPLDRERGGLSMVAMFFVGWGMGALTGFLLSSRRELEYTEKAKDLAGRLKDKAEAMGSSFSESARQALDRILRASTELFERGRLLAETRKKELLDAIDAGKKTIQEELSKAEEELKAEEKD